MSEEQQAAAAAAAFAQFLKTLHELFSQLDARLDRIELAIVRPPRPADEHPICNVVVDCVLLGGHDGPHVAQRQLASRCRCLVDGPPHPYPIVGQRVGPGCVLLYQHDGPHVYQDQLATPWRCLVDGPREPYHIVGGELRPEHDDG